VAILFGGDCWPIGWKVGFLERPYREVVDAMDNWETAETWTPAKLQPSDIGQRLLRLAPLQAPAKRELVIPAGDRWTAHLTNDLLGGDSGSWVGHLSSVLACQGVVATHIPVGQYRFPCTQFELLGPEGRPPLNYIRTISAGILDEGRWRFDADGDPLLFEETEAYKERRIRDRFTRPMLIRYLRAIGIDADDPAIFGREGTLYESQADYTPRSMDLDAAREQYATSDK
jgi:hypothetical protein